jgi:UDP:flavonoid glycosyltransferase YjiC (YdhE family)
VDVLINNGGYGAIIQCLQVGVPLVVAGQGQDKNVTNTIVDMKEVGVNLGNQNPSVDEIRTGVAKVLEDKKYKRNAVAMSANFKKYDMATAFDEVIQGAMKKWLMEKRQKTKSL